ncbi:YopX family protein [Staphylococcus succinus]|uniref:YopX family protein n=1 Tax=Staphylococcus succinus TaxID=61015 RepID=UPI003F5C2029
MIKFRAWDEKHNEMIRVISINFDEKFIRGLTEVECNLDIESSYNFEDIEILQSTGLKDKNGVEIFEGDVLELPVAIDTETLKGEVVFEDGVFGIKDVLYGWGFEIGLVPLIEIILAKKVIIVGNKYQHPHLLKE